VKKENKKTKKIMLITLISIIGIFFILAIFPRQNNYKYDNPMRTTTELPILIAHGGGNKEFPDNTLEAFYNAYSVDQRVMMETDVSITKDGVVILSHDTTLDRKTNVTGAIADWNYSDLISQKVDFGYTNEIIDGKLVGSRIHFVGEDGKEKYPTDVSYPNGVLARDEKVFLATSLEELLIAFPNNRINVEIKQSGDTGMRALKEILRLLDKYNAYDRVVLASFHEELYVEYKRLLKEGEVPNNFMFSPATKAVTKFFVLRLLGLDLFFNDKMCVFQLPMEQYGFDLATKGFVRTAHRHNLAVHYWTINDVEDMKHLVDIGADGIMTDYPHKLKEVFESYNN
jgi:glycerophosphoryl diester phosphodiesterase